MDLPQYDAGLLNDYGGGNVEWWQNYIRQLLESAHDFYQKEHDYMSFEERMEDRSEGYSEGRSDGYSEGQEEGYSEGYESRGDI